MVREWATKDSGQTKDIEPKSRFMHNPGEIFWNVSGDWELMHVLVEVRKGFDPAGVECEEYIAICGVKSQSFAMPSQGIKLAQFGTLEEGLAVGVGLCEKCKMGVSD